MKEYRAKGHYQNEGIVRGYEEKRFSGPRGWLTDRMEKRAIRRALSQTGTNGRILDLPCGTGRFSQLLGEKGHWIVEADVSGEMIQFARGRGASSCRIGGYVRCDAENLPFRSGSFDAILCFRFLPHLPLDVRMRALSELARVSRGPLIIDYRYKYTFRSLSRLIRHRLGIAKPLRPRYSIAQIASELGTAGLDLTRWIPVVWLFSEKVVLVCRRRAEP